MAPAAPLPPAPAGFAPRTATPHPNPGAPHPPVRLHRQPTPPAGLTYAVAAYWEERFGERSRRDGFTQALTLHARPADAGHWTVTCESTAPAPGKPDLSALEQVHQALAGLYQRLVLRLSPDGRPVALLNHGDVLGTWQGLRQELLDRAGGGADAVTRLLVPGLDALLAAGPGPLLSSLRYHYLYDALFANCYGQRFASDCRYAQPRRFAAFFADAPLCLTERLAVARPPAPGRVARHGTGGFDEARTDRPALARCIDAAWAAAGTMPDRPATDPAAVRAAYDAAYDFDAASGWPVAVALSARCRAGGDYHKEYFLSLTHTP